MNFYTFLVPFGLALFGVGFWPAPAKAMEEAECSIPTILRIEDLVRHSLACNGTQQAMDDSGSGDFLTLLTAQLQLLEDRRKTLAAGAPVAYEAVVYLQKTAAGPASVKLNYFVNDCGWNPSYNFRGDTAKGEVAMEFKLR